MGISNSSQLPFASFFDTCRFNIDIPLNSARHKLFLTNKFNWHKREFSNCDPVFAVGFFNLLLIILAIPLEKAKVLFHSNKYYVTIRSFNRRESKISFDKIAEFSTVSEFGYNYHIG